MFHDMSEIEGNVDCDEVEATVVELLLFDGGLLLLPLLLLL